MLPNQVILIGLATGQSLWRARSNLYIEVARYDAGMALPHEARLAFSTLRNHRLLHVVQQNSISTLAVWPEGRTPGIACAARFELQSFERFA
jgi:hypothetical protein